MGLFDKKYCDICGEKIGLLGNRKLEDGNLCKNCASKLSPWFDERCHSTVEQIREQLAYREANRQAVAAFYTTRTIGRTYKVYLDENAGNFMVSSARNLMDANPDVVKFEQVTGCDLDIHENRSEEFREITKDGKTQRVSYNPPRYKYSYDFYVIIRVNTPYFDEMRFKLNDRSVEMNPGQGFNTSLNCGNSVSDRLNANSMNNTMNAFANALGQALNGQTDTRMMNNEYAEYYTMGQEIVSALTQIRNKVREDAVAAAQPKTAVTCPYCGATTIPDENGKCEFCWGAINN